MKSSMIGFLTTVVLAMYPSPMAQATPPLYHLTDLGALGGSISAAISIDASGRVVGTAQTSGNTATHAFIYSGNTMTDLGTVSGGDSYAESINASGQIVGQSKDRPFLYSSGTMSDLGTLGGSFGDADAINAIGQIVGNTNTSGNHAYHAFSYSSGTMSDLGTLGGTNSIASGINASGQIVGQANTTGDAAIHAFLYSSGTMTDLGTFGGTNSQAFSINASGQIVGHADLTGDSVTDAFLYGGGTMTDLGTLGGTESTALAINASGSVVGDSYLSGRTNGPFHAFLYTVGTMYDLNSLLDSSGIGWTLEDAEAINDNGWIAANGLIGGVQHGLLLTPVPEPSALVLAAFGIAGLGFWIFRLHKNTRRFPSMRVLLNHKPLSVACTYQPGAQNNALACLGCYSQILLQLPLRPLHYHMSRTMSH